MYVTREERERLARVGQLVRETWPAHYKSAQAAADEGRVGRQPWGRVQNGMHAAAATYAGIERALKWERGSIERYLRDGAPEPGAAPALEVEREDHRTLLLRTAEALSDDEAARVLPVIDAVLRGIRAEDAGSK